MVTGLTYVFTSIALAIVLPHLLTGDGHRSVGDTTIYRYPKNVSKFFLCAGPVFACLTIWIYSTYPSGKPSGVGLIGFGFCALCALAFPVGAYLYFRGYCVLVENQALRIITIVRTTVIEYRQVAQIATFEGKGRDLWLYDHEDKCLANIGGSLQDFGSLLLEIERHTRSPSVNLYKGDQFKGWQERTNEEHSHWRPSKGPRPIQRRNRNAMFLLLCGLISVAFTYWISRLVLK